MAVVLHDLTGLPVYGLEDSHGELHHVFVYDEDTEVATDSRGTETLEKMSARTQGTKLTGPFDAKTIQDWAARYSTEEYDAALEAAPAIEGDLSHG